MLRRSLVVLTVAAVAGFASVDLSACGDKFLRAGRSARTKGYAAVYPASILIYKPSGTVKGLQEFESLLKKAGHKPVALRDRAALPQTLTSARYDLIIADYSDTLAIKGQFSPSPEPGFLPILHNPTRAQETEAAKHFQHVLKPEKMTKFEALEQIDRLMKLRRKGT